MNIRRYEKKDLSAVLQLFYDSVHVVCAHDCTKEQLFVWADGNPNRTEWNGLLLRHATLCCRGKRHGYRVCGFGE